MLGTTIEGKKVATHCEYPKCGKKLPKRKPGAGKPRQYCDPETTGRYCAHNDWARKHPRARVAVEA